MKRIILIFVLCACVAASVLVNVWLFVSRYYIAKADHALIVEIRKTYQAQGCRLPGDVEQRLDHQVNTGFQDLGELNEISMELRRLDSGHSQKP